MLGSRTLFNALTRAAVLASPRMFATLDPTIRGVVLPSKRKILMSDTVGFIRQPAAYAGLRISCHAGRSAARLADSARVRCQQPAFRRSRTRRRGFFLRTGHGRIPRLRVLLPPKAAAGIGHVQNQRGALHFLPAWHGNGGDQRLLAWLRMNPTVSDIRILRLEGRTTPRIVGSSVANMRGEASTAARVRALNQRRLPSIRITYKSQQSPPARTPPRCRCLRADAAHVFPVTVHDADASRLDSRRVGVFKLRSSTADRRVPIADPPRVATSRCRVPPSAAAMYCKLRQLHLQTGLPACARAGKNVEDQLRTVDHAGRFTIFSTLRCCEAVRSCRREEDRHSPTRPPPQFLPLACAD